MHYSNASEAVTQWFKLSLSQLGAQVVARKTETEVYLQSFNSRAQSVMDVSRGPRKRNSN